MITSQMTVKIAHTVTASQVEYTNWIYTGGYTKVDMSVSWTGTIVVAQVMQGTNEPFSVDTVGQPEPTAAQIFTVNNFTAPGTITGGSSTASSEAAFDNVLPLWIRVQTTESNAAAGVVNYAFNFKSAS